jgi:hypothetical protein
VLSFMQQWRCSSVLLPAALDRWRNHISTINFHAPSVSCQKLFFTVRGSVSNVSPWTSYVIVSYLSDFKDIAFTEPAFSKYSGSTSSFVRFTKAALADFYCRTLHFALRREES